MSDYEFAVMVIKRTFWVLVMIAGSFAFIMFLRCLGWDIAANG